MCDMNDHKFVREFIGIACDRRDHQSAIMGE